MLNSASLTLPIIGRSSVSGDSSLRPRAVPAMTLSFVGVPFSPGFRRSDCLREACLFARRRCRGIGRCLILASARDQPSHSARRSAARGDGVLLAPAESRRRPRTPRTPRGDEVKRPSLSGAPMGNCGRSAGVAIWLLYRRVRWRFLPSQWLCGELYSPKLHKVELAAQRH